MNAQDRGLELKVGLFVFVGLAMVAVLVVQFGRLGEGIKKYYEITVQFPDASGLLKGSDVLLTGAKIGRVSGGPVLVPGQQGVAVPLRIYDFVKIPAGSRFTVGSSGLLGDRFVAVSTPQTPATSFVAPNSTIKGTRETGLDDLTREGGFLVQDLRKAVQNINGTVTRLNENALSQATMDNLKASLEHLNQTTGTLAESSKKIDGVIEQAKTAAESANGTMLSGKKAADDLQLAIADARKLIQTATQTVREASTGKGLLPTLLTNQETANNLKALISNLRAHGVLFYRDSAETTEPPRPAPARRRGDR